jgi:YVTN family beta-propeller protein
MVNVPAHTLRAALLGATLLASPSIALAAPGTPNQVSTGQMITPVFSPGSSIQPLNPGLADNPDYRAGQAINTALSPDGKTLLVVTSGYNLLAVPSGPNAGQSDAADSEEYVFVYDTTAHNVPKLKQVVKVPYTFIGLTWSPDGTKFYVSGGVSDNVQTYTNTSGSWALSATAPLNHPGFGAAFAGTPFAALSAFLGNGLGFEEESAAAGLAVTPDGSMLAVTNIYNDSISVISTATNTVLWEYDLRPYYNNAALAGQAGGETPFDVAIKGTAATGYTVYVTSERDREVVVLPLTTTKPTNIITRIPVSGSPNRLLLSHDQTRLYVAQDNSDAVAVIDTTANTVLEEIDTIAPPGLITTAERYTGAAPNSLALSPDGNTLYVTNGGANSVAVIPIAGAGPHATAGLIPTGWYPNSVSVSKDGSTLYVVNDKSVPGRDPAYEKGAANQYVLQRENSGLLRIPVPFAAGTLAADTAQVAKNNGYTAAEDPAAAATMAALHSKIQHVIYIVKENRTFDQILGDLTNGANADPKLTMYGKTVTPNFHAISNNFVTLDNFLCSGEVSGNGWAWSTESRESDFGTKTIPMNYAGRGSSNDSEGSNRIVNVGLSLSNRIAAYPTLGPSVAYNLYAILASVFPGGYANLLPGNNDDFGTDGPESTAGESKQLGHIWDAALKAGLTVRDYGFFDDIVRYNIPVSIGGIPNIELPQAAGTQVAWSTNPALAPYTDIYFRGFDNAFPDAWRWEEWNREFQGYVANNNLPNLSFVRFMHDHTGNFSTAAAGVNTPELQQADNDFAVGKLVETVAKSPYAGNTLIFVLEDDSQDGPDHVDAHRSTAYIVGPYVKQHAVVSTRYSTVNMLRTIEDVLGLDHLSLNDAHQPPMADVFDLTQTSFNYTAVAAPLLYLTGLLPLLPTTPGGVEAVHPTHTAAWWAEKTKGYDWSSEDKIPTAEYNRILWEGLKGGAPYPEK